MLLEATSPTGVAKGPVDHPSNPDFIPTPASSPWDTFQAEAPQITLLQVPGLYLVLAAFTDLGLCGAPCSDFALLRAWSSALPSGQGLGGPIACTLFLCSR